MKLELKIPNLILWNLWNLVQDIGNSGVQQLSPLLVVGPSKDIKKKRYIFLFFLSYNETPFSGPFPSIVVLKYFRKVFTIIINFVKILKPMIISILVLII